MESKKSTIAIVVLSLAAGGVCFASNVTPAQVFGELDRRTLIDFIGAEQTRSASNALVNQWYDIAFKVLLFVVSCLAAVGAARVAALDKDKEVPVWLKTTNLALTALVPLITTLAFSQFDFFKRQTIWERRQHALLVCKMSLQYLDPDRAPFLANLNAVLAWGDGSSVGELTAGCIQASPQRQQSSIADVTLPTSSANLAAKSSGTVANRR